MATPGFIRSGLDFQSYRELIVTTPGLGESISGAILYDETIRQQKKDGTPLVKVITDGEGHAGDSELEMGRQTQNFQLALTGALWLTSLPDFAEQQRNKATKIKITSQDTSTGCVSGRAVRLHVRSKRPAAAFAGRHSRPIGEGTRPV